MSENHERTIAFLRLSITPGLGPRLGQRLLDAIGDPRAIDGMNSRSLADAGMEQDTARHLASPESHERARAEWERARSGGIRIVDLGDPGYPALLREIADPPLVLYVRGHSWDTGAPHLAIVGSRRPTPYGINCAERIARDLAERGFVVVSGLARGIDTAAHRGALLSGTTAAVLGTGVDRVYPSENHRLADAVSRQGALVSEFPMGSLPLPQNFPRRNRILAGMSLGTLVVEAAERSGSLITARFALEANREVFAVPGPIHSPASLGPHQLIQDGACLTTGWQDIVRELVPKVEFVPPSGPEAAPESLTSCQAEILGSMSFSEDVPIDHLLSKTRAPASEVYSALMELELRGLVRRLPGDRYIRSELGRSR